MRIMWLQLLHSVAAATRTVFKRSTMSLMKAMRISWDESSAALPWRSSSASYFLESERISSAGMTTISSPAF
jgi:hypothetical protein